MYDPGGRAKQGIHQPRGEAEAARVMTESPEIAPVWLSVGYAVSPAGRHQTKHLCVCVCVHVCVCVCAEAAGGTHFYVDKLTARHSDNMPKFRFPPFPA